MKDLDLRRREDFRQPRGAGGEIVVVPVAAEGILGQALARVAEDGEIGAAGGGLRGLVRQANAARIQVIGEAGPIIAEVLRSGVGEDENAAVVRHKAGHLAGKLEGGLIDGGGSLVPGEGAKSVAGAFRVGELLAQMRPGDEHPGREEAEENESIEPGSHSRLC